VQSQLGWLKEMHNTGAEEFIKTIARKNIKIKL
jgi:hypothetical protein